MASSSGGLRKRGLGAGAVKEEEHPVSTENGDQDSWEQILIQVMTCYLETLSEEGDVR